jgi:carbamoyltransferase
MRAVMNVKVKHREEFRPFCPTVLREEAPKWFEIPGEECQATDFMLCACPTRAEYAALIPAVVHVDGTARIQTVSEDTNPLFTELLRRFHERTGVPILLNTSFNDSEPIVCSPSDAIETFEGTSIDYLAIGPFLVPAAGQPERMVAGESDAVVSR